MKSFIDFVENTIKKEIELEEIVELNKLKVGQYRQYKITDCVDIDQLKREFKKCNIQEVNRYIILEKIKEEKLTFENTITILELLQYESEIIEYIWWNCQDNILKRIGK